MHHVVGRRPGRALRTRRVHGQRGWVGRRGTHTNVASGCGPLSIWTTTWVTPSVMRHGHAVWIVAWICGSAGLISPSRGTPSAPRGPASVPVSGRRVDTRRGRIGRHAGKPEAGRWVLGVGKPRGLVRVHLRGGHLGIAELRPGMISSGMATARSPSVPVPRACSGRTGWNLLWVSLNECGRGFLASAKRAVGTTRVGTKRSENTRCRLRDTGLSKILGTRDVVGHALVQTWTHPPSPSVRHSGFGVGRTNC